MTKPLLIITGISGRIGQAATALFSEDFDVIGLDVREVKEPKHAFDYFDTDLSSSESVQNTFQKIREKYGNKIASVLHLAAYYNFSGGKWEKYQKITIDGTKHLLEGLRDFEVEQFIFSSTILVYAPCKLGEKITENSPIFAKWEYPLSKVKTEELIREEKGKIPAVILRIAGVYDDECNSIPISQHILRIYRKEIESHLFPGNVHHGSTYLHMNDLIQAFKLLVEKRKELSSDELFVLGEPKVLSFLELQKEIGNLLHGKPWWTIRVPKWFAKMGAYLKGLIKSDKKSFIQPWMIDLADDHYDVDIAKAKKILGWEPDQTLKNSLPKMIQKLKENPQKWIKQHENSSG